MNACIKGPNGEAFTVDCDGDTSLRIETWSNDCWNGNSNTSFISTSNVNGRCEGYMGASGGCNGDYLYVRTADGCDSNGNLWSNSTVEAEMIINQCLLTDSGSMSVHCESDDLLRINYFHDQECNNYNYDDNVNSGCFNLNGFAREFDCSPYVNNGGGNICDYTLLGDRNQQLPTTMNACIKGPNGEAFTVDCDGDTSLRIETWSNDCSNGNSNTSFISTSNVNGRCEGYMGASGGCNGDYISVRTALYVRTADGCDNNGNLWSNSTVEAEMIINQCLLTDSGSM
eukprot:114682_1